MREQDTKKEQQRESDRKSSVVPNDPRGLGIDDDDDVDKVKTD